MDAHAHLVSLGWAGPGHSLDSRPPLQHKGRRGLAYDPSQSNNTGRGLVKPLLISQKKNAFGVGKRSHEPAAGNEWWLKGFENVLSNIGKKTVSEVTGGTATPESSSAIAGSYIGKHNGLYGYFVKGQEMEGTIGDETAKRFRGHKRKSDTFDDEEHMSTSSGTSSPASPISQNKLKPQDNVTADFQQISQFLGIRDKDRKRQERQAKADAAQDFEEVSRFFEAKSEPKKKQRMKKSEDPATVPVNRTKTIEEDPAEERRRRRREAKAGNAIGTPDLPEKGRRKKQKPRGAGNATSNASSCEKENAWSSLTRSKQRGGLEEDSSAPVQEALREAERKRRKEERRLAKLQADS